MCNESQVLETIHYIFLVTSSISVLACICIILIYYIHGDYRGISLKIVLCMSITDLISSLFYYIPESYLSNNLLCQITAIVTNLCLKVDVAWSMCIVSTLKEVLTNTSFKPEKYLRKWYFLAFFILPIFQTLPLITDGYGKNYGICSYKNNTEGIVWRAVGDLYVFGGIGVTVINYFKIYNKAYEFKSIGIRKLIFDNGLIYSIILIFILVPTVLMRYMETFKSFCDIFYYTYIAYILFSLLGFLNFLALLGNKSIRTSIKMILMRKKEFTESDFITEILNKSGDDIVNPEPKRC